MPVIFDLTYIDQIYNIKCCMYKRIYSIIMNNLYKGDANVEN